MKAVALARVDEFSDGEAAAAALLQLATQLQEARAAAEAAQSNAENAARKARDCAERDKSDEIAAAAASAERARNYGREAGAEQPTPRERPRGLKTRGRVDRSHEEEERLRKSLNYDGLLIPVLKSQRFARWFFRIWCAKSCEASLISDVQRTGSKKSASAEQKEARRLHVLNLNEKLRRDPSFGDRKDHLRAWLKRERMRKLHEWGVSNYGDCWRLMGNELGCAGDMLFTQDPDLEQCPLSEIESDKVHAMWIRFYSSFHRRRPSRRVPCHRVSMQENPLRYWPCCDMCTGPNGEREETGTCRHCVHHAFNNSTKRKFMTCDSDYMSQLVSTITALLSTEVREAVVDSASFIVWPDMAQEGFDTPLAALYRMVQEKIDLNADQRNGRSRDEVAARAGWKQSSGPDLPATCAQVRWHTTQISNSSLHRMDDIMAASLICSKGYATSDEDHASAIASPLTWRGFVAEDHPSLGTTEAMGQVIKFLTAPQAKAQRAIMNCIYKLVTCPLIEVTNDKEKGAARMMGVGGLPRRLLLALLDAIWLSTGQRERRHALLHRTHGAEMTLGPLSLKILNPRCAGKLRKVLGEGLSVNIREAAANSISELITDFKRIARMPGWPVPDTTTAILEGCFSRLYHDGKPWDPGFSGSHGAAEAMEPSHWMKMCLLYFAFGLVVQRTASQILDAFRFYIFSPDAFAVGMNQTMGHVRGSKQIRAAHLDALASAVVFKVMGRDLLDHYRRNAGQNDNRCNPLNYFPLWAAALWGEEGSPEVTAFGGMTDRWPGESGWAERNPLDHFYEVQALGNTDEYGNPIIYSSYLPKPLARYLLVSMHVEQAEASANSSKEIEQPWARAGLIHETRKNQSFESLSGHFTNWNDNTMNINLAGFVEHTAPFQAAMEIAMLPGWKIVFEVDRRDRHERKADYVSQENSRKGPSFWQQSHRYLEGSHRGNRWLCPTSRECKALIRLVKKTCEDLGRKAPIDDDLVMLGRAGAVASEAAKSDGGSGEDVEGQGGSESPRSARSKSGRESPSTCAGGGAAGAVEPPCASDDGGAEERLASLAASSGGAAGADHEGSAHDDESNEESADEGDSVASESEEEFADVEFDTNTWSVQFALDCFNAVSGLRTNFPEFCNDVWLLTDNVTHDAGNHEATVRRRATDRLKRCLRFFKCSVNPAINFTVEQRSPKCAYIRYDNYAGIQYVWVERILSPATTAGDEEDWSATMDFRVLFTTKEALGNCSTDEDEGINLGRKSLRKLIAAAGSEVLPDSEAIFHQGTTLSSCDIRMLIGIVRWYPAKREQPTAGYWQNKKLNTDILKVGDPFVQRLKRKLRNQKK